MGRLEGWKGGKLQPLEMLKVSGHCTALLVVITWRRITRILTRKVGKAISKTVAIGLSKVKDKESAKVTTIELGI
jgi:hypothetical protein